MFIFDCLLVFFVLSFIIQIPAFLAMCLIVTVLTGAVLLILYNNL